MNAQRLIVTYIAEPMDYVYSDNINIASYLDEIYSFNFIYKVIDYAVGRIREQQSGE